MTALVTADLLTEDDVFALRRLGRDAAEAAYGVVVAEARATGDRLRYTLDRDASEARRAELRQDAAPTRTAERLHREETA